MQRSVISGIERTEYEKNKDRHDEISRRKQVGDRAFYGIRAHVLLEEPVQGDGKKPDGGPWRIREKHCPDESGAPIVFGKKEQYDDEVAGDDLIVNIGKVTVITDERHARNIALQPLIGRKGRDPVHEIRDHIEARKADIGKPDGLRALLAEEAHAEHREADPQAVPKDQCGIGRRKAEYFTNGGGGQPVGEIIDETLIFRKIQHRRHFRIGLGCRIVHDRPLVVHQIPKDRAPEGVIVRRPDILAYSAQDRKGDSDQDRDDTKRHRNVDGILRMQFFFRIPVTVVECISKNSGKDSCKQDPPQGTEIAQEEDNDREAQEKKRRGEKRSVTHLQTLTGCIPG